MNLNSYLGLIARNFRTVIKSDAPHLEQCDAAHTQLRIRDAKYVLCVANLILAERENEVQTCQRSRDCPYQKVREG